MAEREGWEFMERPGRGPTRIEKVWRPPENVIEKIVAQKSLRSVGSDEPAATDAYPTYNSSDPIDTGAVGAATKLKAERGDPSISVDDFVYVPFYDVRASAGHGAFVASAGTARHYAFDREWLARQIGVSPHRLALIPISGNSMEPELHDGDMVMIDRGDIERPREGVYVFEVDDSLFVKRLFLRGDRLVIESSNADFPPREISLMRENPSFRLHGRVIGVPMFKRL